jgi:hypothetical protein
VQPLTTLIVLSSAHEVLYRRYFQPTLPEGLRLLPMQLGDNQSDGAYMSKEWQDANCAKVRHALAFCRQAPEGEPFIVSDVDVQFFPAFDAARFLSYVDSLGCDLAFQRERFREGDSEANCGFYTGRNTPAVRRLLESSLDNIERGDVKNEQNAVNCMLRERGIPYATLDRRFYARTHGFPPPKDIWMHHASWTTTIQQKIRQLDRVRRIVQGGFFRLYVESYAEHLSRPPGRKRGPAWLLRATGEYASRFPIKPGRLP